MKTITLLHGNGGKAMHELIEKLLLKNFDNACLRELGDAAFVKNIRGKLAYSTDSFVVNPIFFPGGDIGKLSVCGTVNDLAVSGAMPEYLSCGLIVEEGFGYDKLEKIILSMKQACDQAGVKIVTGDFKVVEKNSADRIFINTSGIGQIYGTSNLSVKRIKPGDKIIINGTLGDHGAAILMAREELKFKSTIKSDCASLNGLIGNIIDASVKFMRDPTRGGLATTLSEISLSCGYDMMINQSDIPVKKSVREFFEILGFDPLYMANEGKAVFIVSPDKADKVLSGMKKHPLGKNSRIIGEVMNSKKKKVYLRTSIGGRRIVDMISGEQLPRIC